MVDRLDPRRLIRHRLYRDTTTFAQGFHRKDLDALNRDLGKVLIIDVDKQSFAYHPKHGIEVAAMPTSLPNPYLTLTLTLTQSQTQTLTQTLILTLT